MNQHNAWSLLVTLLVTYAIGFSTGIAVHWALGSVAGDGNNAMERLSSLEQNSLEETGPGTPTPGNALSGEGAPDPATAGADDSDKSAVPPPPGSEGVQSASASDPATPGVDDPLRVAQHLIVSVEGAMLDDTARSMLERIRPGGVVLIRENLQSKPQTERLIREIKSAINPNAGYFDPPYILAAQEGGRFNVLALAEAPTAARLGDANDAALARETGIAFGRAAAARGINVILGPVLDVYEPATVYPSLETRAFGTDQHIVAQMGITFADGLREGGVIPVVKHFPGFGAARYASDGITVHLDRPIADLAVSMYPFNEAAREQVGGILVGHAAVPVIDKAHPARPASLSPILVRKLLRDQWAYEGVILADDLALNPMIGRIGVEEAALQALAAGCDAVLFMDPDPERIEAVVRRIEKGVHDGELAEADLEASKERLGRWRTMLRERDPSIRELDQRLDVARQVPEVVTPFSEDEFPAQPVQRSADLPDPAASGGDASAGDAETRAPDQAPPPAEAPEDAGPQVAQEATEQSADPGGGEGEPPAVSDEPGAGSPETDGAAETAEPAKVAPEPAEGEQPGLPAPSTPEEEPPLPERYVVARGDSLEKIGLAHDISVADLKEWNNLTSDAIDVGQELLLAPSASDTADEPAPAPSQDYTVQLGDTLSKIGRKFGVPAEELIEFNDITRPNLLSVGETIKIPLPEAAPSG